MKINDGIETFQFGIENVLKKYGKWFLKMCGNPVLVVIECLQSLLTLSKCQRKAY